MRTVTDRDRLLAHLKTYLLDMEVAMRLLGRGWTKEGGYNVAPDTRTLVMEMMLSLRDRLKAEFDRAPTCGLDEAIALPAVRGACAYFVFEPDEPADRLLSALYSARIDISHAMSELERTTRTDWPGWT